MDLKIDFTDREITPWAGISLMLKMLDQMFINDVISSLSLPQQGSNRGYSPEQLIIQFWISVWCGANCFDHLEVTRSDKVIQEMCKWKRMAGRKSFQRYFSKFNQTTNQEVFTQLYQWFFDNLKFDNYTLDFDSTILTRYGEQEGAAKGYNVHKPGRNSHHPLLAFVSDCRMIANCWLRPGNTGAATNFLSFLEDTLNKLRHKKVGLIRCDSGFFSGEIFDYLESKEINYIVAARFVRPIKLRMAHCKTWWTLDSGLQIGETTYQAETWEKPRRLVMVRQEIKKRPKAAGKQLRLFPDDETYLNYRYSCYITNMKLPAKAIYDLYRGRADCENRIKEIKYDFGAGSFCMKKFWATETALNFITMAYNLMSLFRQVVLQNKNQQNFLKTIRYNTFAIGGYVIRDGNSKILKLSMAMRRREWFKGLWNQSNNVDLPLIL